MPNTAFSILSQVSIPIREPLRALTAVPRHLDLPRHLRLGLGLAAVAIAGLAATVWHVPARQSQAAADSPRQGISMGDPGPLHAGWRRETVSRPDGTTFTAILVYPAVQEGENTAPERSRAPYPAIAFGHGFAQTADRYQPTLAHLATWGIIAIAPESFAGFLPAPDHAKFAADLSLVLTHVAERNALPDWPLVGLVNTSSFGVSGHSMGGGASLLAAAADKRIRAVANLAAAETQPSAVGATAAITAAVDLIVGTEDRIVPVNSTRQMYDAALAPRQFAVIQGGSHCGFEDEPFPIGCDSGSLPRAEQLWLTRKVLVSFFLLYLGGEADWRAVWGPEGAADSRLALQSDPGIMLREAAAAVTQVGTVVHTLAVKNTGPRPDRYRLEVADQRWPTELSITDTPRLEPGKEVTFTISVRMGSAAGATSQTALVSARSLADGVTRAFVMLRTEARATVSGSLLLPWGGAP